MCSMGSIVGGLYACYGNADDIENHIFELLRDPKFKEMQIDDLIKSQS